MNQLTLMLFTITLESQEILGFLLPILKGPKYSQLDNGFEQ